MNAIVARSSPPGRPAFPVEGVQELDLDISAALYGGHGSSGAAEDLGYLIGAGIGGAIHLFHRQFARAAGFSVSGDLMWTH